MNIANSGGKLTQMPTPIVAIDGAPHGTAASDAEGAAPAGPADAGRVDAQFARVLTQRMAEDSAKDDAGKSSQILAAASKAPTVEQPSKDPKELKAELPDDAIGNDLAAQFSLASQWTGAPPSPARGPSASSAEGAASASGTEHAAPEVGAKRATARSAKRPDEPRLDRPAPLKGQERDTAVRPSPQVGPAAAVPSNALKAKDEPIPQSGAEETRTLQTAIGVTQAAAAQPAPEPNALHAMANLVTAHLVAAPPPAPAAPAPDLLRQVVGTPAWSHEVGNAMVRMAVGDLQSASLRLHPEHLGPLDVQVRVDNGVAHLAFQAAHADTRQALEASRPMLEHLFSEQGLKIGDCAVGDSASRNAGFNADGSQADGSSRDHGPGRFASRPVVGDANPGVGTRAVRVLGMVDTFA